MKNLLLHFFQQEWEALQIIGQEVGIPTELLNPL